MQPYEDDHLSIENADGQYYGTGYDYDYGFDDSYRHDDDYGYGILDLDDGYTNGYDELETLDEDEYRSRLLPPRPPYPDGRPGHGHEHGHGHDLDYSHGQTGRRPTAAPPGYTPQKDMNLRAVDPGSIRRCLYQYAYIWLNNGQSFWFYPTYVGRRSVSGYRWTRFGWVYTGYDLNVIQSFVCMPW